MSQRCFNSPVSLRPSGYDHPSIPFPSLPTRPSTSLLCVCVWGGRGVAERHVGPSALLVSRGSHQVFTLVLMKEKRAGETQGEQPN